MLASDARILRGHPGAGGRVARSACRDAAGGVAAAIQLAALGDQVAILRTGCAYLLTAEVRAEIGHRFRCQGRSHAGHDRVGAGTGLELGQLLRDVVTVLAGEIRVHRDDAVAVDPVAGGTGARERLAFRGVTLGLGVDGQTADHGGSEQGECRLETVHEGSSTRRYARSARST